MRLAWSPHAGKLWSGDMSKTTAVNTIANDTIYQFLLVKAAVLLKWINLNTVDRPWWFKYMWLTIAADDIVE